jgi:biotin synthase
MQQADLIQLLSITDQQQLQNLYARAYAVKKAHVGTTVYFRGIIELSNICTKDCLYCGIRRSNRNLHRYLMNTEEILAAADWAWQHRYGSIVLQSGERQDPEYTALIEELITEIQRRTKGELGEQTMETYERWFKAGAHRYLLRIETSNKDLYRTIHPADHLFEERVACLRTLKNIGYQTGTGVMIGLPGQTLTALANDILFFKEMDVDMIGMGPWIPHDDAPLTTENFSKTDQFELGLKMIAVTRIYCLDYGLTSTQVERSRAGT